MKLVRYNVNRNPFTPGPTVFRYPTTSPSYQFTFTAKGQAAIGLGQPFKLRNACQEACRPDQEPLCVTFLRYRTKRITPRTRTFTSNFGQAPV